MSHEGKNNNIQIISPCNLYLKWHKANTEKVEEIKAELQWLSRLFEERVT